MHYHTPFPRVDALTVDNKQNITVAYCLFGEGRGSTYTAIIGLTQNLEVDLYARPTCTPQFTG